jgi:hypothetical protein
VEQQVFELKYLGLPTPDGRMHKGRFLNLQSKLSKLIIEWGDGVLAQRAREILIKAIAQALPVYVMSMFKLPLSLCDELTRLIRNFRERQAENTLDWLAKIDAYKISRGLRFS